MTIRWRKRELGGLREAESPGAWADSLGLQPQGGWPHLQRGGRFFRKLDLQRDGRRLFELHEPGPLRLLWVALVAGPDAVDGVGGNTHLVEL